MIATIGGEESIRDNVDVNKNTIQHVLNKAQNPDEFISVEALEATVSLFPNLNTGMLVSSLKFISENWNKKYIRTFVEGVLLFNHRYLVESGYQKEFKDDLPSLVKRLRGAYTSSRSTDPKLEELKKLATKIAKKATKRTNKQVLASIKNGILLYLFIYSRS